MKLLARFVATRSRLRPRPKAVVTLAQSPRPLPLQIHCRFFVSSSSGDGEESEMSSNDGVLSSSSSSSSSSSWSSRSYVEIERDIGQLQSSVREAYSSGKYAEAQKYAEACKGMVERHFGSKHPVFASCENNLALIAKSTGDLPGAIASFESAAGVYLETVGKDHVSFATCLHNLALCYRAKADSDRAGTKQKKDSLQQARAAFSDALDAFNSVLGENHPQTALTLSSLASIVRAEARESGVRDADAINNSGFQEAEEMLVRALRAIESHYGEEKADLRAATATAANNLAFHYRQPEVSRFGEAEELYRRAVQIRERVLGCAHPDTVGVKHNLAELVRAAGREDEAVAIQMGILQDLGVDPEDVEGGGGSLEHGRARDEDRAGESRNKSDDTVWKP